MKKIIIEDQESKIRLSEVTDSSIILVKQQGKFSGIIINVSGNWLSRTDNKNIRSVHEKLSDAIEFWQKPVEFFVL